MTRQIYYGKIKFGSPFTDNQLFGATHVDIPSASSYLRARVRLFVFIAHCIDSGKRRESFQRYASGNDPA